MPTHIALPDERAEQLRRFAETQDVSIADAVAILINDAIAAGKMARELPGIEVEIVGKHVKVDFGAWSKKFNRDYAKHLATMLRAPRDPKFPPEITIALHSGVNVVRRGGGIKIVNAEQPEQAKVLSLSVAADLADIIDDVSKR